MSAAGQRDAQINSAGTSGASVIEAAFAASRPQSGLRWLDVGCGTGDFLRAVRDRCSPARLAGIDVIDWLAEDLRDDVELVTTPAEDMPADSAFDRVVLLECMEHLDAPWSVLRRAAGYVVPGGAIVVTTPNIATLRSRLDLAVRGQLTSFRASNLPHLGPIMPHVTRRVLEAEGFTVGETSYAMDDVVPLTGGRAWPASVAARFPSLLRISTVVVGTR